MRARVFKAVGRYLLLPVLIAICIVGGAWLLHTTCSYLVACGGPYSAGVEIERVTSPDGALDAVLTFGGGLGPTYGPYTRLYVVPTGTPVGDIPPGRSLLSSQNYQGEFEPRWREDRTLDFRYEAAIINGFTNFDYVVSEQGEQYEVEVRLVPLDEENSLLGTDET